MGKPLFGGPSEAPELESRNTKQHEPGSLVALNFKVKPELKKEFKVWAASQGMTQREVLEKGFDLVKKLYS